MNCTFVCIVSTIWPTYVGFDVSKPAVDVLQSVEDADSHSVTSQAEPWMRTFRFDGKLPKPCETNARHGNLP